MTLRPFSGISSVDERRQSEGTRYDRGIYLFLAKLLSHPTVCIRGAAEISEFPT